VAETYNDEAISRDLAQSFITAFQRAKCRHTNTDLLDVYCFARFIATTEIELVYGFLIIVKL
jgi:hypothetical protein